MCKKNGQKKPLKGEKSINDTQEKDKADREKSRKDKRETLFREKKEQVKEIDTSKEKESKAKHTKTTASGKRKSLFNNKPTTNQESDLITEIIQKSNQSFPRSHTDDLEFIADPYNPSGLRRA